MDNQQTPETDAAFYVNDRIFDRVDRDQWQDFARKLERERDEARQKYDDLATEHMLAINRICNERDEALNAIHTYRCEVEAWELLSEARRERDKAQYKLEDARQSLEVALGDLSEAKRERDEARGLLKHAQSALDAIHLEIAGWIKTMSVASK
jgi:hypothetical protein